jgi:hypothetical protein
MKRTSLNTQDAEILALDAAQHAVARRKEITLDMCCGRGMPKSWYSTRTILARQSGYRVWVRHGSYLGVQWARTLRGVARICRRNTSTYEYHIVAA